MRSSSVQDERLVPKEVKNPYGHSELPSLRFSVSQPVFEVQLY